MFDNLIDKLYDELTMFDKKVASGQDLDENEYKCADTWAHTLKSLSVVEGMDEARDDMESSYRGGNGRGNGHNGSYRQGGRGMTSSRYYMPYRGGSYRNGRNGGGYSYADEDPMEKLQEAYDNAATEQERKTIRKLMEQM